MKKNHYLYIKFYSSVDNEKLFIIRQKEDDFLRMCDEYIESHRGDGLIHKPTEVCKIVASMKAPRFYISSEKALYEYRMRRSGKWEPKTKTSKAMHDEIASRYNALMEASQGCAYGYSVMDAVVEQEAPSFYLTPKSAVAFFYRAMKHKRERSKK